MATFDYFVGDLLCPACGTVSARDSSTNMQTKISTHPEFAHLSAGQRVDADWGDICSAGYIGVRPPLAPDSITLLETWECPECRKPFNWARIHITHSTIQEITAVALTYMVLSVANYITEDCRFLLSEPGTFDSESTIERLLMHLRSEPT